MLAEQAGTSETMQRLTRLKRRDGREFIANLHLSSVCDSEGQIIYLEGIVDDVTERQIAENALRESEATYRSLVTAMAEGAVFQAADGTVTAVNPAAEVIEGRTAAQMLGHASNAPQWKAIREDGSTFPNDEHPAQVTLQTGQPQHDVVMGIHRPDGELVWISINSQPVVSEGGSAPHAVVTTFHDVSDLKHSEAELRRASRYARSLLEASLDPLVTIGPDGRITDVNRATEQVTGLARQELIGTDFADYFTDPVSASAGFRTALENGMVRDYPLTIRATSGECTNVMYNATTYVDEAGTLQGVFAAARDMSEVRKAESETRNVLLEMVEAISLTVEKRDPYTSGHQKRVADLASEIAGRMGLDASAIEGVRMGGMIHDIGKIHIPVEILAKPGRLSASEWEIIKSHPAVGAEIVHGVHSPWPIEEMVLQHHERLDGSGYPQGLKGDEILLEARILAVADVVEAMASHRPYRPAMGVQRARDEIADGNGTLFDPAVVEACDALFADQGFDFGP